MDLPVDAAQTCSDFVQLIEEKNSVSSLIGTVGRSFCGQQLPNYPGTSVLISGNIFLSKFHENIDFCYRWQLSDCQLPHCHDKLTKRERIQGAPQSDKQSSDT